MQDNITELPIAPNPRQKNADQALGHINHQVEIAMERDGVLSKDSDPRGRHFVDSGSSLFGYDGVVVHNKKIVSLVNLGENESVPPVRLGTEVTIVGDSRGYVSSGHKPGERVKVIGFVEPFYRAGETGLTS